jgi:hypothetical protein
MKTPSKLFPSIVLPFAVLLCSTAFVKAQNIVVNPGFETGTFAGWTHSGNTGFSGVTGGGIEHSGSFGAFFGPVGSNGFLSQTLSTTPGSLYDLSFWLRPDGGSPSNFSVSFNGVSLLTLTNPPTSPYTQFTFTGLLATSNSTGLIFSFRDDPSFFSFDDVSVSLTGAAAVPDSGTGGLLLSVGLGGLCLVNRILRPRPATA